jgi:hypothetical protein
MSHSSEALRRIGLAVLLAVIGWQPAMASDPPDSRLNPVSGDIETTDSTMDGDDFDVRHVITREGVRSRIVTTLTTDSLDDLGPRLAISSAGDTWVVWWRDGDTDEVRIRKRTYSSGTWGDELRVSDKTESSRNPELVHDGSNVWVVFEFDDGGDSAIAVSVIGDDPNPVGARMYVSATDYSGELDTLIHHDGGHLWVTWIDSATQVGWSEYDHASETWGGEGYESYSSDSVEEARQRIRDELTGE